ncbi:MAG: hypothetical protein PHH72_09540, partial [Parabacteroides sp.]|nr:hypothetical protein [Parabacteroides sp.]
KLGEGSKTALPIFGLFMEKVLADNNLSKYRAKFPKPTQPINKQYECMSPRPLENDSIDMLNSDSLFIEEEEPEYIDAEAPAL